MLSAVIVVGACVIVLAAVCGLIAIMLMFLNRIKVLFKAFWRLWVPSSVKNSQAVDLESGNGALRQSNLPEIGSSEGDSLQI